jgi:hypothetical protein
MESSPPDKLPLIQVYVLIAKRLNGVMTKSRRGFFAGTTMADTQWREIHGPSRSDWAVETLGSGGRRDFEG